MKGSFRLLIHEEHKYRGMFVLFLICAYFNQRRFAIYRSISSNCNILISSTFRNYYTCLRKMNVGVLFNSLSYTITYYTITKSFCINWYIFDFCCFVNCVNSCVKRTLTNFHWYHDSRPHKHESSTQMQRRTHTYISSAHTFNYEDMQQMLNAYILSN